MRRVLVVTAAAWLLALARPAAASCAAPEPDAETAFRRAVTEAPVVLVGTAQNDGRGVRVRVHEVWRGGAIADEIEVVGGPSDDPNVISSVDRHFVGGTTYVFVLQGGPPYRDNACSATRVWDPKMAVLRPDDAVLVGEGAPNADPAAGRDGGRGFAILTVGAAALLVVSFVAMIVAYRRARS